MQLNITTDYALRVIYILGNGETKTMGEIAEEGKIPRYYLGKVVKRLKGGGILGSNIGSKGGLFLKQSLDKIRLYDVLHVMEPTMKMNRCLEADSYCGRGKSGVCPVRRYYSYVQNKLEREYFSVSLAEIQKGEKEIRSREPEGGTLPGEIEQKDKTEVKR